MRDLLKSVYRFSWALSLLGFRQIAQWFTPGNTAPATSGPAAGSGVAPAGPPLGAHSAVGQQPGPVSSSFSSFSMTHANSGNLNTARFMVLGEGLAAGAGDFSVNHETQVWSFPAQMARQMSTPFTQRLIQAPGIGNFTGFATLPVRVPAPPQTTVLQEMPPAPVSNLAIPEFRLDDALEMRPRQPLVDRSSAKQTAVNLTWGLPMMAQGIHAEATQVEYAAGNSPTFAIVELGYYEALEAAVTGNPNLLPEADVFITQYREVINRLKSSGAEVLVLNIPDPLDTAHFATLDAAARLLKVEPSFLLNTYGLAPDDLITVAGFTEISFQLFAKTIQPLPPNSTLPATAAQSLRDRVSSLNQQLATLAAQYGILVYDLASLFRRIAREGHDAGRRRLSGEYLGGFYSLNGYYPGQTGQAIIANEILDLLNRSYGAAFPAIDLNTVISTDPVAAYRQAEGRTWSAAELAQAPAQTVAAEAPHSGVSANSSGGDWSPFADTPAPGLPLRLPPGLEQVLPLNNAASYFGDGISPVNGRDPQGIQWGTTGNLLFGGLAMVDSHLNGNIRIRFSPPVNDITKFQIDFMGGFTGDDSVLVCPQYFKMGFQQNRVDEFPGTVSSGTLNLATGEVSDLQVFARYSSTALLALVSVNPTFPNAPIIFKNPPPSSCPPPTPEEQRIYASAWAQFEQRPDGLLDFSFYGSMFVPLGPGIVWPLNFTGPDKKFATIPAAGTVMHPHLSLSTKAPQAPGQGLCPEIPFNTLQEFTLFTHNSAFGDAFSLNVAPLGGPAKGRSHLLGRLQIQFGARSGNSVPMAVWALPPGGIMAPLPGSPITQAFPGRLSAGPQGFNETLRFPLRSYSLDDLSIIDDPFDVSVSAVDLQSGHCLNDLLHRAFISQNLFFALVRVEPCTPQSSFFFRGPAVLAKGPRNERVLRFQGIVHIPYPPGFKFPQPDFTTAFVAGPNSALDPFLWFHAIQSEDARETIKEGGASHIHSSIGDEFSFRYVAPSNPVNGDLVFEYENHSQQGKFQMHSLAWIDFSNSGTSSHNGDEYDTVSFSGFGVWTKDGRRTLQQAAVQISTSAEKPYIGIQIASGDVSNVNTKPVEESTALP